MVNSFSRSAFSFWAFSSAVRLAMPLCLV
jgi:hypothetical protein